MTDYRAPVLNQLAGPPDASNTCPGLILNHTTGLLHAAGEESPYIEQLISAGAKWRNEHSVTTLTETKDPHDPDWVRGYASRVYFESTSWTNGETDHPDPDTVRAESVLFVQTQEGNRDSNFLRSDQISPYLATDLKQEAPDPDLVKLDGQNREHHL